MTSTDSTAREVVSRDRVVIRFAGDSGDGMQLTGDRFTSETASFGNDLSTLPNFPAEIRAPAGTLPGVSSFQLHFANYDILTPGDRPDVLVAMNPAALKANVGDLPAGGILIVNTDEFTKRNLTKVGYDGSPLDDGSLERYTVHEVAMATLTRGALEETGLSQEGRRAGEEHVRPGPAVVDVPPAHRGHGAVPAREVRQAARPGRGERAGVQGRARVRRDHRVVRRHLRGRARPDAPGHVPADHRQHGAGLRDRGGRAGHRAAGVPRLVPDHAGQSTSCTS